LLWDAEDWRPAAVGRLLPFAGLLLMVRFHGKADFRPSIRSDRAGSLPGC